MYLKSYHLVPGQTINVFDAIFRISLPLISKSKAVRQMAGFWVINSHFGGILDHDPMGVRTCRILYTKARTSHAPV